ncbi:endonuclease/exonuclease/phosphatase family protein [Bifidobacterium sp. 64T4]|uniref:endonuclease/exonuclease/phosphatase family protein n=1 Tax=Bifidobacterium pongonis TaxID=2834432 RepID=UPI001C592B94|nr:endonuclease/exonuclease/phosphatase family protein [Bifidobacterium pongonis]MBW3094337.1 endonuclease/exonuclease/phosphatase family protein [Bifidobacterium pongonis]
MMVEIVLRLLPADLQALPYIPIILLFVPWFILVGALAFGLAVFSRRLVVSLLALACLCVNCWWQYPFFSPTHPLPVAATSAVAHSIADTDDQYARVMTLNVYKGEADAQSIVDLVREERVEVLALQETTNDFVEELKNAHIETYLPYSQVSTMDGAYGNGLWSATPLGNPVDDAVNSSASFMPGGTVRFSDGQREVRFVSVHTTSPRQGDWRQWKRSLDELGLKRGDEGTRYVFMGDFNATMDHASMREFLGSRFRDAAYGSGHGFAFTSPTNLFAVPAAAAVDHVVVDSDMTAGQVQIKRISGSDHAALLATIDVGR